MADLLCPYCHKVPASPEKTIWPFCSVRCKQMDLGHWSRGDYRVPAEEPPDSRQPTEDDEDM